MAEQQTAAISAAFPAPPPFYKAFTASNLAQLKSLKESSTSLPGTQPLSQSQGTTKSLLDLPPELRYLTPPAPPLDGRYRSFGEERSVCLSPPSPIIAISHHRTDSLLLQVHPTPPSLPPETPAVIKSPPTPKSLTHLTRSILLNFLEFVHILATDPSSSEYGPKWDDIRDLFRNAHVAVNEYRPFQAREALIMMMEEELEKGRAEIRAMKAMKEKVDGILAGLGEGLDKEIAVAVETVGLDKEIAVEKMGLEGLGKDDMPLNGPKRLKTKEAASEREERMWKMLREEGNW